MSINELILQIIMNYEHMSLRVILPKGQSPSQVEADIFIIHHARSLVQLILLVTF